jgi:hypothetical protein
MIVQICVAVLYCFIVAIGGFIGMVIVDILLSKKDTRSWTASTGPTFYYRWDLGGWARSLHDMDIEEVLKVMNFTRDASEFEGAGYGLVFFGIVLF